MERFCKLLVRVECKTSVAHCILLMLLETLYISSFTQMTACNDGMKHDMPTLKRVFQYDSSDTDEDEDITNQKTTHARRLIFCDFYQH